MARRPADLHALAGPYALDALPARDRARFERHLAACEPCGQEVRSLVETAAMLAGAAAVPPASRLRERVLAEVARTRQLPPVPGGPPRAARGWPRSLRWAAPAWGRVRVAAGQARSRPIAVAASAVLAVAVAVLGSMALITQHRLSQAQARDHMLAAVLTAPDMKSVSVTVPGGGTATIVMSRLEDALAFSAAGLPALPAGKAYELWLMGPPGARPAAMLPRPERGMTAPVIATGLRAADKVELTVEPAGGASRPTSQAILLLPL